MAKRKTHIEVTKAAHRRLKAMSEKSGKPIISLVDAMVKEVKLPKLSESFQPPRRKRFLDELI